MRARTATRIEETANSADQVEQFIRTQIPKEEVSTIIDNIGLPYSGINTSYANNGTIGTADVEILCSLNQEHHGPTARPTSPGCARNCPSDSRASSFSSSPPTSSARS